MNESVMNSSKYIPNFCLTRSSSSMLLMALSTSYFSHARKLYPEIRDSVGLLTPY